MTRALLILVAAYLVGSIPFSYLVARLFGVGDVRKVGSGNVGATNVMRSAGKAAGLLALTLDAAKGSAASLGATRLAPGGEVAAGAAVAAMLGHMYPIWLSFKGGKGVATGVGAFLPLAPAATVLGLLTFVVAVAATRFVSVGSCIGATAVAVSSFVTGAPADVCWCAASAAVLIVWRHGPNLRRVFAGTERRLGGPRGAA
jgi:acyl phosphate:glycerol-3-phosphate acyltransferase